MSVDDEVFRRLQSAARSAAAKAGTGAPTQEYLIRHTLESFLDRLTRTAHAEAFVLKGGILLAAYGVRRPTKDADTNAVGANVTAESPPRRRQPSHARSHPCPQLWLSVPACHKYRNGRRQQLSPGRKLFRKPIGC